MPGTFRLLQTGVVASLALTACKTTPEDDASKSTSEAPPVYCDGSTAHRWDITDTDDVDFFPDGLLEVEDPNSPTGRGIVVTDETARWLPGTPSLLMEGVLSLNRMSGFGTLGGVLLRFTGGTVQSVPQTADESVSGTGWQLLDLGGDTPERVPFEVKVQEDGITAVVWPLRPLRLGTPHAFVLTTDALADDGGCIAPSPTTQALLYGDALPDHPHAAETATRYRAALDQIGLKPDDVSVFTAFTTHDETLAWRAMVDEVDQESAAWGDTASCSERGELLQCTVYTTVLDRRNAEGLVDPSVEPVESAIPVTVWLPNNGSTGPYPVLMYGHGLGSRRTEGYLAAELLTDYNVAVVAMEAVSHGDHPSADGRDDNYAAALGFLGLDLSTFTINPNLMQGNFDQTNLDRRRLLNLIHDEPDFNGDGIADFDTDFIGYVGVSLGAILGPQLLTMSPEVDGALFSVGGARLMNIVTDSEAITEFEAIIVTLVGTKERFDRLVPIAQHVIDPADSGTWSAHLLRDRWDDAPSPHLLLQVGLADEVVPKTSGAAMARALGLPHMMPVAESVALLDEVEGPLSANSTDGATHAFFQFDRVSDGGRTVPAEHIATPTSPECQLQMQQFLEGWLDDGAPTVVDPYEALGTPAL